MNSIKGWLAGWLLLAPVACPRQAVRDQGIPLNSIMGWLAAAAGTRHQPSPGGPSSGDSPELDYGLLLLLLLAPVASPRQAV